MSNAHPARTSDQIFREEIYPALQSLEGYALMLTKDAAEADDLMQVAAVKAWRLRDHYSNERPPHAWLRVVMRNDWIALCRRRATERKYAAALSHAADLRNEESAPMQWGSRLCERMLAELSPEQARVVRLVDLGGLSYREAAQTLGLPMGTVMSRLHRGRLALREAVAA